MPVMPWCIARISARISCPTTNNCKVSHTHQDPDQPIGEKGPPREVFWDLIDVSEKQALLQAKTLDDRLNVLTSLMQMGLNDNKIVSSGTPS